MAKNKRYAENPLLYIHQPDVGTPNASMQSRYQTSKNKAVSQSNNRDVNNKIPKGRVQRRYGGKLVPNQTEVENPSINNDTPSILQKQFNTNNPVPKSLKKWILRRR